MEIETVKIWKRKVHFNIAGSEYFLNKWGVIGFRRMTEIDKFWYSYTLDFNKEEEEEIINHYSKGRDWNSKNESQYYFK